MLALAGTLAYARGSDQSRDRQGAPLLTNRISRSKT